MVVIIILLFLKINKIIYINYFINNNNKIIYIINNNMTKNIYGTIGYTILKNDNHNVIVFADMHDQLLDCNNNITISNWLKNKFDTEHYELFRFELSNYLNLYPSIKNKILKGQSMTTKPSSKGITAQDIRAILNPTIGASTNIILFE